MYVRLLSPVDKLRLRGPAGLIVAVMDDFGAELVAAGLAIELTRAGFKAGIERGLAGNKKAAPSGEPGAAVVTEEDPSASDRLSLSGA